MDTNALFEDGTMSVRLSLFDRASNTDKFHETSIRFDPSGSWVVETAWGRQGNRPQTKSYRLGGIDSAKSKGRAIVRNKLKKGYTVQPQAEKEAVQAMTRAKEVARRGSARNLKKRREEASAPSELMYELSRVTSAMHRLAKDRYHSLTSAEGLVRDSMKSRFGDGDGEPMVKELWGRLYEPMAKRTEHQPTGMAEVVRSAVHEALDELPEWAKIQDRCGRDAVLSSVTSRHLSEHVIGDIIKNFPAEPEADEQGEAGPEGQGGDQPGAVGEATTGPTLDGIPDEVKADIRGRLAKGIQDAHDELDEAEQAMGFAFGDEDARINGADPDEALALAELMSKNTEVRDLLELVGRYLRSFRAVEASEYGRDGHTPFSVTPGDELRRLLPTELLGLANPMTSLQTLYRYTNRETLCYDVRSKEPKDSGPFVVCLDTSGSMDEQMTSAKAFAIASMETAAREGRDVHLVRFSGNAHPVDIKLGTPGERVQSAALVARIRAGGGTSFNEALTVAENWLKGRPGADVLMVTDGESRLYEQWAENFETTGTQVHYIHLGGYGANPDLEALAVQTLRVDSIDSSEAISVALGAARGEHRDEVTP